MLDNILLQLMKEWVGGGINHVVIGSVHILCNHVRGEEGQGPPDDIDYALKGGEGKHKNDYT